MFLMDGERRPGTEEPDCNNDKLDLSLEMV